VSFPLLRAFRKSNMLTLLGLSTVNLGLCASYRHSSRGSLPMDLVVKPLIKALRGVDGDLISNRKTWY
jgi:hypothetical protein